MQEPPSIIEQLDKNLVARVPIALSRQDCNNAANAFLEFLTYPKKSNLHFKIDPNDRGSNVGYLLKQMNKGDLDNKEYFHYHPLADLAFHESRTDSRVDEFLKHAKQVYVAAKDSLDQVLAELDLTVPDLRTKFYPTDTHPKFFLRFLKYDSSRKGDFLAKGHYDRGGCTLAISESAPGLRVGLNAQQMSEVTHHEFEARFMPAYDFDNLTGGRIKPVWHDVVQRSEDQLSSTCSRWAIVLFADTWKPRDEYIKFEEAHEPKY